MNLIDDFIAQYVKEIDYYQRSAQICAGLCEQILKEKSILAIVTYRAKKIDSLKAKLENRNREKEQKYNNFQSIYEDVPDLAGVRIALYFPGDIEKIDKLIKNNFYLIKEKIFPKDSTVKSNNIIHKKIFSGYKANHYRINMIRRNTGEEERFNKANIEIQVASVLMHAWSEVEHDLVYKPNSGDLSIDEHLILDEINGMVLAGEISLQLLQKAMNSRRFHQNKPFSNQYELISIIEPILKQANKSISCVVDGFDFFWDIMKKVGLDKPTEITAETNRILSQINWAWYKPTQQDDSDDYDEQSFYIDGIFLSTIFLSENPEIGRKYVLTKWNELCSFNYLELASNVFHKCCYCYSLSVRYERYFFDVCGDTKELMKERMQFIFDSILSDNELLEFRDETIRGEKLPSQELLEQYEYQLDIFIKKIKELFLRKDLLSPELTKYEEKIDFHKKTHSQNESICF